MFIRLNGRASGFTTHVRLDGPPGGEPVLLVHSLGTAAPVWERQTEALGRAGYRVVRPELRGHGLSEAVTGPCSIADLAHDMIAVLDALGVSRAHVGGISIGGMVAQALAAEAAERVLSLMLIDTALVIPSPESWAERARAVRAQGLAALAESVIARWVTPAFRDAPETAALRAMLTRTDPEGYASAAEAIGAADLTERTRGLRVPALVLVGAHDPSTPPGQARALAEAIDGAELITLDGGAHIPLFEEAEAVNAALLGFLRRGGGTWHEAGARTRAAVLGEAHVARARAATTATDAAFQDYITGAAWGAVWSRPDLDRRTRSLITLALLAAFGHEEEFRMHVRATANTGASEAEIAETLLHVALYAGIPAANAAMRALKAELAGR